MVKYITSPEIVAPGASGEVMFERKSGTDKEEMKKLFAYLTTNLKHRPTTTTNQRLM